MRRDICAGLVLILLLIVANLSTADELLGKKTLNFSLASSEDRLINYGDEYYGKYALIMTFFPAAFTPV